MAINYWEADILFAWGTN